MVDIFLTDVCRPKQWKTISTSDLTATGYPVYGANGKIGYFNKYTHEFPTVLITCRGATCGTINISEPKSYVNGNAMALDNLSENYSLKYLYYILKARGLNDVISGSAQPQITRENLSTVKIPNPDFDSQQKIAALLDKADELRQYNKNLIEKYDELTRSLFFDMFGDPVKNEKKWEIKKLGNLSDMSSGSTPSRTNETNFIGNIPWVKTTEVNGKIILDTLEKISESALKNSSCKLYPKGSIVIAMYGQGKTRGQIGILGIEAATNQACCVLKPTDKINFTFLYYTLSNLYNDMRELGRGGNQPNLNLGLLKNYEVILPERKLQNQFAERVQIIENQKEQAQQALQKSEDLFNSLLQKAFKGELIPEYEF